MKSYDEMTKNVLKRRDEALILLAKKKKRYIKTASVIVCFGLVALIGFLAVKNQFPNSIVDTPQTTEIDKTLTSDTIKEDITREPDNSTETSDTTADTSTDSTVDTEPSEIEPEPPINTEPEYPIDTEPQDPEPIEPEPPTTVPDFSSYPRYEVVPYQFNNVAPPESFGFFDSNARNEYVKQYPYDKSIVDSLISFSIKMSGALDDNGENLVYSPVSLYYTLSVLATGATGDAQSELLNLLNMQDASYLALQCENLYRNLYTDNEVSKLKMANSVWIDQNINPNIKADWLDIIANRFFTSAHSVDFTSPQTGDLISDWISNATSGKLSYDFTPDYTKAMSLINSLYFYDEWDIRFDSDHTQTDLFTCDDGTKVECEFMNEDFDQRFYKSDKCNIASLDLKDRGSVYFLLPNNGIDPIALLCDAEVNEVIFNYSSFFSVSSYGPTIWKIPKFSYENSVNFKDSLRSLGVNAIFDTVDGLSGISDFPLIVNDVDQKTCIGIDEEGIEGATYTEVEILPGSPMPTDTCEMLLDRPFAYMVVVNNTPLFVGVVNDM